VAAASGLADLQARLSHWSRIWSVDGGSSPSEAQRVLAERLCGWIECCFGKNAHIAVADGFFHALVYSLSGQARHARTVSPSSSGHLTGSHAENCTMDLEPAGS
jgi:hypothetical protein